MEIGGEFAAIPIFQFGVLYEMDLDVHPTPPMVLGGRIHSNGDIYFDPDDSLSISAQVTTSGNIYNRRKQGWASGGTVDIMDSLGVYQAMAGLDSDDPDWSTDAIDRWDGRVRSGDLGGDRVDLVIEDPTNPRIIIEAGRPDDTAADQSAKIWYDAALRIVNGRAYDSEATLVSSVDPVTGQDAIRTTVIYDWREEKYMLTVEVDVEKLGRSPVWPLDPVSGGPAEAVVYVGAFEPINGMPPWPWGNPGVGPAEWSSYAPPWSGTGTTEFAIKLTNGDTLPAPMTMVSENPTYIQGSFNIVNKKGAAVMADAVTILSNRWGDVNGDGDTDDPGDGDLIYSLLDLSSRDAWSTTMNAAIMSGNVDMGMLYNGGLENLPRFLERWSSDTLTLYGSLIALWESVYANADFGKSNVYNPPNRDWYFDQDFLNLANLPPETPRIYQIRITGWEHR